VSERGALEARIREAIAPESPIDVDLHVQRILEVVQRVSALSESPAGARGESRSSALAESGGHV
jgi:hypothetical protein